METGKSDFPNLKGVPIGLIVQLARVSGNCLFLQALLDWLLEILSNLQILQSRVEGTESESRQRLISQLKHTEQELFTLERKSNA